MEKIFAWIALYLTVVAIITYLVKEPWEFFPKAYLEVLAALSMCIGALFFIGWLISIINS